MKLSQRTLDVLRKALTGADGASPRLSKVELVAFFRRFGFNETYVPGAMPAPKAYVEYRLARLNGTPKMVDCIEAITDPGRFRRTGLDPAALASRIDRALDWDGFRLVADGDSYIVTQRKHIDVEALFGDLLRADTRLKELVRQQVAKSDRKLRSGDFDGAITNARSLIECILIEFNQGGNGGVPTAYDGDLPRLYKRVSKAMNLDAARYRELPAVLQLLQGLVSVVHGLASMSNAMADRHAPIHRAIEHHARLAVNASKTLCEFLAASHAHQSQRSTV